MKKNLFLKVTTLLLLTITLTGCTRNAVEKALDNTMALKNYNTITNLTVGFANQEPNVYTLNGNVDNKSNLTYITTERVISEEDKITYEMYYNSKNNETYYSSELISENMGSDEENHPFKNVMDYLFDAKTLRNILSDPKKITKESGFYIVEVKSNKVVEELNNEFYFSNTQTKLKKPNTKNVEFIVYVNEEKQVTKIEADLTEMFKIATKITDELSEVTTFSFEMSFTNHDKAKSVSLPKEMTENVIDVQEGAARTDAYLYLGYVNMKELEDSVYKTATEIEGIKPKKVNLEIKDKRVQSGTITIGKYTFNVKDGVLE